MAIRDAMGSGSKIVCLATASGVKAFEGTHSFALRCDVKSQDDEESVETK